MKKLYLITSIIPIKAESLLILNSSDSIIINDTVIKVVNILHPHLNKYWLRYLFSINLYPWKYSLMELNLSLIILGIFSINLIVAIITPITVETTIVVNCITNNFAVKILLRLNPTIKHTDINKPLKPANDDNIIITKIAT